MKSIDLYFDKVQLVSKEKGVLKQRAMDLLHEYNDRACRYSSSFHGLRIIITIGSLIVPALLSVQYMDGNVTAQTARMSAEVYWVVWVLSLLVTMSNGAMTLLKIDKKHFVMNTTFQHLLSECWQFIELSGRYSIPLEAGPNTHDQQYLPFCHMMEKIRMKQVQDEYYKVAEQEQKVPQSELLPWSPPANFSKSKVNGAAPTDTGTGTGQSQTTIRRQDSQKNGLIGTAFETASKGILRPEAEAEAEEIQIQASILAVSKSEDFAGKSGNSQQSEA